MSRPGWDFDYAPVHGRGREPDNARDMVVATVAPTEPSLVVRAIEPLARGVEIEAVLDRAPLHWLRVRTRAPLPLPEAEQKLRAAGVSLRYLASAERPSQALPPPMDLARAAPFDASRAHDWAVRARPPDACGQGAVSGAVGADDGYWFLGSAGVHVERLLCGDGAGTRLAVIDNEGGKIDACMLDALVPVGREPPDTRRHLRHAALLIAWAAGATDPGFAGVAPAASPRLYCVPKLGAELVTLPLAIVRAVDDGADVIGCATYVDGMTSPMLDDALSFAARLGRGGRGTAVVLAASREVSSPEGSVRASLSLDLGDPAADPRVFCAAPSSRDGGWFLWRDQAGELQPFANRGPAVRFSAPGDDIADPFHPGKLQHSESSGATALVSGVLLLLMATDPTLTLGEIHALLASTAVRSDPSADPARAGRDHNTSELLPLARDPDGHDAKHGYGRLDAALACASARDPIALVLATMGEREAALAAARSAALGAVASPELCRYLRYRILGDAGARHALAAIARHARLVAFRPERALAHAHGALVRQLALALDALCSDPVAGADHGGDVARELATLAARARRATADPASSRELDSHVLELARTIWARN